MAWASAVSELAGTDLALHAVADAVEAALGGREPDLLLAFASSHHARRFDAVPAGLARRFPNALLVGCSAGGVIGGAHEIEGRTGFSLTAAALPGVALAPLRAEAGSDAATTVASWAAPSPARNPVHVLLFPDPFTADAEGLLGAMDARWQGGVRIGGLASGGTRAGSHALWLGGTTWRDGAVGVALSGDLEVDTIVAQGCRPIGQPMLVTRCEGNRVRTLDERTPLDALRDLARGLDDRDRELFRSSLLVGLEMRGDQEEYHQGDFLIRQLHGLDPETGAIAIGCRPEPWQVLQFHVRDAVTSAEDLGQRLERYRRSAASSDVSGALLFSCLGRGEGLYGHPDHDSALFQAVLGDGVPLGGFFCNGEIGPVGGTAFVHGFTSAFALFRSPAV